MITDPVTAIVAFYAATLAFALAGYPLLMALGWRETHSWMAARVAGMAAVTYPAWIAGVCGFGEWRDAGLFLLAAGVVVGGWWVWRRPPAWRELAGAEMVFTLGSAAVLLLRLGHPEILGGEKLMDLALLAGLLRTASFPPADMWLAGEPLAYYYWGSLFWVLPVKASAVNLALAYNLAVAALAGMTLSLAWSLGTRLYHRHRDGAVVALMVVLMGTPDGMRQLFVKRSVGDVSLWESSRQDPSVITEFPLFSFWLGDLHPHLLSMPLALFTWSLALSLHRSRLEAVQFLMLCIMLGIVGMTNPWALPPTFVAASLLVVVGDGTWRRPWGRGATRWMVSIPLAAGALVAGAPFFVDFAAPVGGLGFVHANTAALDLLWYGGVLILPVAGAAFSLLRTTFIDPERGLLVALFVFAAAVVVAAATAKPTLVLLGLFVAVLLIAMVRGPPSDDRPALALAVTGTAMFLLPELIFVVDAYGERLHRMNTVFKSYHQGWMLLALAWPALVRCWLGQSEIRYRVATAAAAVLGVPHLAAAISSLPGTVPGLDGLRWMSSGDRAVVEYLRTRPTGSVIVEAVGDAYSQYARISSASGVPAYLGWANHEIVWRGAQVREELEARQRAVEEIYTSGDAALIRRRVRDAGIDYVVIGALEKGRYREAALSRLSEAGTVVFESGDSALLGFDSRK